MCDWGERNMDGAERFVHKDLIERELAYSEAYRYLDRYVDSTVYARVRLPAKAPVKPNRTIWIFWMQGMEHAPRLVRICHDSICRNKPEGYDLIVLSAENLREYIELPEYIWDKYKKGKISTTHLSDVIRLELLCMYGGCWIDATVFCSGPIPDYMVNRELFMFRASSMDHVVLKMSNWWICAEKSDRLIHATRNAIQSFWKHENSVYHYYLMHLLMSKLIDEDFACRSLFYDMPYFYNGHPHILHGKMEKEFDQEEWDIIKDCSVVHKLSYKQKYLRGDIYNYYQALRDGRLI